MAPGDGVVGDARARERERERGAAGVGSTSRLVVAASAADAFAAYTCMAVQGIAATATAATLLPLTFPSSRLHCAPEWPVHARSLRKHCFASVQRLARLGSTSQACRRMHARTRVVCASARLVRATLPCVHESLAPAPVVRADAAHGGELRCARISCASCAWWCERRLH